MFDVRLLPQATKFLEGLGPTDQDDVLRLLGLIGLDPYIDGKAKFPYALPPATVTIYLAPMFWIVYPS